MKGEPVEPSVELLSSLTALDVDLRSSVQTVVHIPAPPTIPESDEPHHTAGTHDLHVDSWHTAPSPRWEGEADLGVSSIF